MEKFDIESAPLEIERKFLVAYPDLEQVRKMPGYRRLHIEQTYLSKCDDFIGGRIRKVTENGRETFIYTYKEKISDVTRREFEREISEGEYRDLMRFQTDKTVTIEKDRHVFEFSGLTYELDVYAFWRDRATLEAEVESETTKILIPPCVTLIREVTHDSRYNNSRLAFSRGLID